MNDDDFRDACAMLAMVGIIIRGNILSNKAEDAKEAFAVADHMLQVRRGESDDEEGIVSIKKRVRKAKE
jgi:hypothetical protein